MLVIRLGALGDAANTLPAIRALRVAAPGAWISWVVEERIRGLAECVPDVDEVVVLPRRAWSALARRPWQWPRLAWDVRRFVTALRRRRLGVALDFQGNLKSGLLSLASGAARRVGFGARHSREFNALFTNERARMASRPVLRVDKNLALVRHVFPEAGYERPRLCIPAEDEEAASAFLDGRQPRSGPLVLVHPGVSGFGAFKRWPEERFGTVARLLHEKCGAAVVITWGRGEREIARTACLASGNRAALGPATPSLGQLAALVRRASLLIACDTGPLHLAAALGTPVVGIFGPKDPAVYAPFGSRSAVVRSGVECSPCTKRRCRHMRCMMEIQPEDVFAAAARLLAEETRALTPAHRPSPARPAPPHVEGPICAP